MARTAICGLLRVGWDTVGRIVARVVADHLDERRLEGLVCIGVDEISYRRHHRCPKRTGAPNILRHSDARTVRIALRGTTLEIVNDGARRTTSGGTGLASRAARCAAEGARLVAGGLDDGRFEVRVEWRAMTIRVLLAEDEEMIRDALVGLLEREPDIEVVATAADGRQAIERALTHPPGRRDHRPADADLGRARRHRGAAPHAARLLGGDPDRPWPAASPAPRL